VEMPLQGEGNELTRSKNFFRLGAKEGETVLAESLCIGEKLCTKVSNKPKKENKGEIVDFIAPIASSLMSVGGPWLLERQKK